VLQEYPFIVPAFFLTMLLTIFSTLMFLCNGKREGHT